MAHVSAAARVGVSTRARTQLRPSARVSVHAMRPRATSAAAGAEPGGEDSNAAKKPRVVIAGAGIIGSSIAYHLAVNHGYASTLVDKVGPGAAASGKAAGFLALDWCDGGPLAPLARASFPMHERLAKDLDIESYRRVTCEAVTVDETLVGGNGATAERRKLENVQWADVGAVASRAMGDETTVAQVHPKRLVEAFLRRARELVGSDVVVGDATEIVYDDRDESIHPGEENKNKSDDQNAHKTKTKKCVGLRVDGVVMPADVVIVATGPWTNRLLPPSAIGGEVVGQKYHAVRIRPGRVLSQAVFFQGLGDPEFYPRPDGDVYVCAYPDAPGVVTEEPGRVEVRPEAVRRLENVARALCSEMRDPAEAPAARDEETGAKGQSCHLPVTADGAPIMGKVPGTENVYVATGHSCWGILNAPASGAAMAELVADGSVTVVRGFERFAPRRDGDA